jgi:DNA-damage-inducible protein J
MTTLNIRIEEDIKQEASAVFDSIGLDMSSAIKTFLKQSIIEQGLPFRPSKKSNAEIRAEWDAEVEFAKKYGKRFVNAQDALKGL